MDHKFRECRESDKALKHEFSLMLTCVWIKINLCRDGEGNVMSCINFQTLGKWMTQDGYLDLLKEGLQ